MRWRLAGYGLAAAILMSGVPALAQGQSPKAQNPTSKSQSATAKDHANHVTLLGCLEREKDYRARVGATKGGPLGSNVGQANEFVLSSAKAAPANGTALTRKEAVATAGENGDYELTGKTEADLKQAIGRQIEVIGMVQPFDVHESAKDSRDRLPRLMISSWHRVADSCAGTKK
jgi:hypothetical protein